jgi:hypothetical protein
MRSIAATGIELISTKFVVMFPANALIATRRPLTSTSVASAPSPLRLIEAALFAVESWLLPRVRRCRSRERLLFHQLLQVVVPRLAQIVAAEGCDRRWAFETGGTADAGPRDVDLDRLRAGLLRENSDGGQGRRDPDGRS